MLGHQVRIEQRNSSSIIRDLQQHRLQQHRRRQEQDAEDLVDARESLDEDDASLALDECKFFRMNAIVL